MHDFLASKKLIWTFLSIGILAILVVVVAWAVMGRSHPTNLADSRQVKAEIQKNDIDPARLPEKFPADFPQEAGATILINDTQTTNDGRFQSTRSYITKKTLDENVTIFQNYFKKQGWTISATVDQPRYKMISATKDGLNIQVSINDNETTKQKTVDIFVVQ